MNKHEPGSTGTKPALDGWDRKAALWRAGRGPDPGPPPEIEAPTGSRDRLLGDALGDIHMAYDRAAQGDWLSATTYLRFALDQMEDAGVTGDV